MQDEEGYTTLNFLTQVPASACGHPDRHKGLSALSPVWGPVALTLSVLCLALFLGLMALLVVFFQTPRPFEEATENPTSYQGHLQGIKSHLSSSLQEMRDSLCLEGMIKNTNKNKNNEVTCTLCPANWKWEEDNSCYYVSTQLSTWEQSQRFCASKNSTLRFIDS
ncbi:C-type lectin domain family 12 member B-like [Alligator sinensis]|uniref:C-type lectin domain family 12 member B-like n=1 Tax=Alligator sinensis TaxID=38654 RepID=A0A3Q0FRB7_ALLSI|nr:C-type lectin domain family 12 member B-like [Alligator sinensis]